jgi:putative transcriptional regulator
MRDDLFNELLDAVKEMKAVEKGGAKPGREYQLAAADDIVRLRTLRFKLSQGKFARLLGVNLRTLQNWEQGRRKPEGPARVLLQVAAAHPEAVLDVVSQRLEEYQIEKPRPRKVATPKKRVYAARKR